MSIVGCQCNDIPEAHCILTLYMQRELLKSSRDIKVRFILRRYLKVEEIIELFNICRHLKYFHISLVFLTNSSSDDSNTAFHIFLTFPFMDLIIIMMYYKHLWLQWRHYSWQSLSTSWSCKHFSIAAASPIWVVWLYSRGLFIWVRFSVLRARKQFYHHLTSCFI